MVETLQVEPDSAFIKEVLASGGAELKKCLQCATCTSVCALSDNGYLFPRKQMVEAQWGLKEKVLSDPAIWLCHDCGDCTTYCPRGAKPSEVMDTLRAEAIKRFAFPGLAGKLVFNAKFLPLLLLIPFLILRLITLREPGLTFTRPFVYAQLFPQDILEPLFFSVAGMVTVCFAIGIFRFVRALRAAGVEGRILPGLIPALVEIVTHRRFSKCGAKRNRYWGHMLTLFGFGGLAATGTGVGVATLIGVLHTPLPMLSGWKIFANLSAGLMLAGVIILIVERTKSPEKRASARYFENFFLWTLAGAAATGILSEILRLTQSLHVMYLVYFIHLNLVFVLFLYAPYSKFAHFVYRTIVMAATRGTQAAPAALMTGAASA